MRLKRQFPDMLLNGKQSSKTPRQKSYVATFHMKFVKHKGQPFHLCDRNFKWPKENEQMGLQLA